MSYDIIGDIHGQAGELTALLGRLGYVERAKTWRHPGRTAIFVGDFIDRGPQQVETVSIARRMVDAGSALAIMGNHEFNAVAWHTPDASRPGEFLRPRSGSLGAKNRHQHAAFLAEVEDQPGLHRELVGWFSTLPLWLDLPQLRVVHACWHRPSIDHLTPLLSAGRTIGDELLPLLTREPADPAEKDSPEPSPFKAAEVLTKGIEIPLPSGHSFQDKDGTRRNRVRVRWWDTQARSYRAAALLDDASRAALPEAPVPPHASPGYAGDKPAFVGHYWQRGVPRVLSAQVACVDYSAGLGGPLCAYRWNGEPELSDGNFVLSR